MSVPTTLTETDTESDAEAVAAIEEVPVVATSGADEELGVPIPAVSSPSPESWESSDPPSPAGRRALREARHERRLVWSICAVVVGACLVITVLIVGMAGDRSGGTPAANPAAAGPNPPITLTAAVMNHQFQPPGALVPEGVHR